MRISDWSSDVCSSDLLVDHLQDSARSDIDGPLGDTSELLARGESTRPTHPGLASALGNVLLWLLTTRERPTDCSKPILPAAEANSAIQLSDQLHELQPNDHVIDARMHTFVLVVSAGYCAHTHV